MVTGSERTGTDAAAFQVAAQVPDPELPMLTLADLGILRDVRVEGGIDGGVEGSRVTVTITPTYSGCPAMREISHDLHHHLAQAGYTDIDIRTALAPAWSSDWITAEGRRKLAAAGIAPPNPAGPRAPGPIPLTLTAGPRGIGCPHCGSIHTAETAPFSGTACKALYRCHDCREPFEYVKEI
jgi:ring-1,2-phenylacetyl-CoA epoxidase subunit PaaD